MAGILTPFSCPTLDVSNTFFVNSSLVTYGGRFFINTSSFVINSTSGKATFTTISANVSNGSTFYNSLQTSGINFENPTFSSFFYYNQANSTETGALGKKYKLTSNNFNVSNAGGFAFTANITSMTVGTTANISNLTPTKLAVKNSSTYISTTGLSINNQATLNSTTLSVSVVGVNNIVLENDSQGNAGGLSLFTETANGAAPATNTLIGDNYVLIANASWKPQGMMYVANGVLTGTPASPNVKNAEMTWANNLGDIFISGWFRPESNNTTLNCYLFFNGAWVNTETNYHVTRWTHEASFTGSGDDDTATIALIDETSNADNKVVYVKMQILETRSYNEAWLNFDVVTANSSGNNLPYNREGWAVYQGGSTINSNGVQGIRFFFSSGNVAAAQWTIRALHRRQ